MGRWFGMRIYEERPYMTSPRYHRPMPYIHCICYAKVSNKRLPHPAKHFLSSFVAASYVKASELVHDKLDNLDDR